MVIRMVVHCAWRCLCELALLQRVNYGILPIFPRDAQRGVSKRVIK